MSIVIIGGNSCMERRYIDTCRENGCKAKIFLHMTGELKRKMGSPDLVILFTNTVSHKMAQCAATEAKRQKAALERCHTSSLNALQNVLSGYCQKKI